MTSTRVAGAVALLVALAAVVAVAWFVYSTPGAVVSDDVPPTEAGADERGEPVLITIEQGQSADDIGRALEEQGIIRSSRLFQLLVGVTAVEGSLEAGSYEFEPDSPVVEVVNRIAEGRTASRQVVIPEGRRAEEIGAILEEAGVVSQQAFLDALVKSRYDFAFLARTESQSLQGYLFPATYSFHRDTDPENVVERMLGAFQENVVDDLQLEGQDLALHEVVTLASIVEREAAVDSERALIAGVFLNRLRIGLPLQADPTVQYALTEDPANVDEWGYWKRGLTLDDLKFESPYNTYVNASLPPGPIASPGFEAIEAVVRPERTEFLFFVAREDGTHVFAETLEEHLQNVQVYQQ